MPGVALEGVGGVAERVVCCRARRFAGRGGCCDELLLCRSMGGDQVVVQQRRDREVAQQSERAGAGVGPGSELCLETRCRCALPVCEGRVCVAGQPLSRVRWQLRQVLHVGEGSHQSVGCDGAHGVGVRSERWHSWRCERCGDGGRAGRGERGAIGRRWRRRGEGVHVCVEARFGGGQALLSAHDFFILCTDQELHGQAQVFARAIAQVHFHGGGRAGGDGKVGTARGPTMLEAGKGVGVVVDLQHKAGEQQVAFCRVSGASDAAQQRSVEQRVVERFAAERRFAFERAPLPTGCNGLAAAFFAGILAPAGEAAQQRAIALVCRERQWAALRLEVEHGIQRHARRVVGGVVRVRAAAGAVVAAQGHRGLPRRQRRVRGKQRVEKYLQSGAAGGRCQESHGGFVAKDPDEQMNVKYKALLLLHGTEPRTREAEHAWLGARTAEFGAPAEQLRRTQEDACGARSDARARALYRKEQAVEK